MNQPQQHIQQHTRASLEEMTMLQLKDICNEKRLKKKGNKAELIERILTFQEEERKKTLNLLENKERWKGFGIKFFNKTDTSGASSSKWNPFKSKAEPIQTSTRDEKPKIPLMKKISQTFSNGINSLKHKASKRFSGQSAAQQGSSITPAGSSKKPNVDIIALSSELDELDIAEEPQSEPIITFEEPTMPSVPSTIYCSNQKREI